MTNGGRQTALRTRIAASKPHRAQYQGELGRGGAVTGNAKRPPGRRTEWTWANSPGSSRGRKCPNAPKLTTRSKTGPKGRARASPRTHARRGDIPWSTPSYDPGLAPARTPGRGRV